MTTVMGGHIVVDDQGIARIDRTRVKVMHLVMAMQSECASAEDLHKWYPHLKLAAIYAALAYYHDHREQVDAQIQASIEFADKMRREHPNLFTREELERRRAERGQA
jgi:uncharacterized protein (DUF433 family)